MSDNISKSEQDLAYLLSCVETHVNKFPVPEHMKKLAAKVRAEFLSSPDENVRPFKKEVYNVASAARDAYLRDVDANDQLSALTVAVDAAVRFNDSSIHPDKEEVEILKNIADGVNLIDFDRMTEHDDLLLEDLIENAKNYQVKYERNS